MTVNEDSNAIFLYARIDHLCRKTFGRKVNAVFKALCVCVCVRERERDRDFCVS